MTSDALTGIIAEYVGGIVDAKLAALQAPEAPQVAPLDPALVGLPEQVAALARAVEELRAQVETLPTAQQPADRTGATTLTIASADCSPAEKAAADYVCDGVADQEQINAAINRLRPPDGAPKPTLGTYGGAVHLVGRLFTVSGPVLMHCGVTVEGAGRHTTVRAHRSFTGSAVFELAHQDVQYATVRDLTIHGGAAAGADTGGVYFNTGSGFEFDACHRLSDLYIYSTARPGLILTHPDRSTLTEPPRDRGHYVDNVRVIDAGEKRFPSSGVVLDSTDCTIVGLDVGSSGGAGIRVAGANNRIAVSKAWFSGSIDRAGQGWDLRGSARNVLVGCEAQDNCGDGFLVGGIHNQLLGYIADSNGYVKENPASTGVGVRVTGGEALISGRAFDKNEANRGVRQTTGTVTNATTSAVG